MVLIVSLIVYEKIIWEVISQRNKFNPASQMPPNEMGQWDRGTRCPGWFKIVFEIFEMIFRKEWHYVVPCRDVVAADHR